MTTSDSTAADAGPGAAATAAAAAAFVAAARQRLAASLAQIEHCLEQLPDDELHWRPFESQNSLCNILLHLSGSLRQWMISGVGDTPDTRDRPREFAERARLPRAELLDGLRATVREADDVLATLPPDAAAETRRIQGVETTAAAAIVDAVAHVEGHTQEIIYITRLRLGDRYVFRWTPTTPEEGAPADL